MPRLARLLGDAREASLLVVHVQNTTLPGRMSDSPAQLRFNLRMHAGDRHDDVPLRYSVEGTPGHEFIEELTPRPGEPVVRKASLKRVLGDQPRTPAPEQWHQDGGDRWMHHRGIVESTARDAMFNDLYVVIAVDCVASDDREQHEASLLLMRHRFDLATADEIASVWAGAPNPAGAQD